MWTGLPGLSGRPLFFLVVTSCRTEKTRHQPPDKTASKAPKHRPVSTKRTSPTPVQRDVFAWDLSDVCMILFRPWGSGRILFIGSGPGFLHRQQIFPFCLLHRQEDRPLLPVRSPAGKSKMRARSRGPPQNAKARWSWTTALWHLTKTTQVTHIEQVKF